MACKRHPEAASHDEYCAACLIEEALPPVDDAHCGAAREFTIRVPLGERAAAIVFLVRSAGATPRLLRLKIWRRPAAAGFLDRFRCLQAGLEGWPAEGIDRPVAAWLDRFGCPSVLTEFRQGVAILDRVRSGRLTSQGAIDLLAPLITLSKMAHARGLVHGSVVAGNVVIDAESGRARLLDFGLTPLMAAADERGALASADLAGFAALAQTLRACPGLPGPSRRQ